MIRTRRRPFAPFARTAVGAAVATALLLGACAGGGRSETGATDADGVAAEDAVEGAPGTAAEVPGADRAKAVADTTTVPAETLATAPVTVPLTAPGPGIVAADALAFAEAEPAAGLERRHALASGPATMPASPSFEPGPAPVPDAETYADVDPGRVLRVADAPVSTFSIDVDTGSYANVRRMLNAGRLPPANAVRIEELVNYFDYDYPVPADPERPFSVTTTLAPSPWNPDTELLRVAIRGHETVAEERPPANLVFLVDVSGSMASPDKLGLLKSSLKLLARGLDARDRVSIVTYAGAARVALDGAAGGDLGAISAALDALEAGGSTYGEAGIERAYALAAAHAGEGSANRVILATDGDFNVGVADTGALVSLIERRRAGGVALTTLGFGTGNYDDELMERLADAGDGNHAYIDTLAEARKALAEQLGATLFTIAKDVKVQFEFDPATVAEYRLLGYENRILAEADFANDRVDAGEIGAGHTVTAFYEISRTGAPGWIGERRYAANRGTGGGAGGAGAGDGTGDGGTDGTSGSGEIGELRLRWKAPEGGASRLLREVVRTDAALDAVDGADEDFRFAAAVAAWGELLRDGTRTNGFGHDDVVRLAAGARGDDPFGYRAGFVELVRLSDALGGPVPPVGPDGRRHGGAGRD